MELNTFTVIAHHAGTDRFETFEIKAMTHVPMASVEHIARMATADKGLVFDTLVPVVTL